MKKEFCIRCHNYNENYKKRGLCDDCLKEIEPIENNKIPKYYGEHKTDVIHFSKQHFSKDEVKGFMRMNALKYITRYDKKNGVEDLKKAVHYLEMLIDLEGE